MLKALFTKLNSLLRNIGTFSLAWLFVGTLEKNAEQKPRIIWVNVLIFLTTFLIAFIGVPYWAITHGFDSAMIIAAVVCFCYCGMSITAGYHRLWSHRTHQAHWSLRLIYALGGAFALQNSALHWSSDHRIHHKHVDDNDVDPYSAKRGFWYSHIGWMLREYQAHRYTNYENVRDMQKDKIVMWQHKNYLLLAFLMNVGVPVIFGLIHGDLVGSLLLLGFMRLVLSHHTTFFINSLAHIWGKQTYTKKNTARDNGFLAFLTFGEGYHNFHHLFENDYRNGIRWYQFDPTKWLIKGCSYFGLTSGLRKSPEDKILKAKLAMTLQQSKERVSTLPNSEQLIAKLQHEYDTLIAKVNDVYAAKKALLTAQKDKLIENVETSELMVQYKELCNRLAQQQKQWQMCIKSIA